MKCKGAIFDMDGLLFDTERIYQETWKELADQYHVVLADGFSREISGTSGDHMCRVIEKYYHVINGTAVRDECMERVKKKLEINVPLKKGVCEILQYFADRGMHIAVASSSPKQQIEANLKHAGIQNYFDKVVSGIEVRHGKPAPDIFLYAAEQIGCQPEECYVFEDSENGIKAGYAAGCVTVMIPDLVRPSAEILPYCFGVYKSLFKASEAIKKSEI